MRMEEMMLRIMITLDIEGFRRFEAKFNPDGPISRGQSDDEILSVMHLARSQLPNGLISKEDKQYSTDWHNERVARSIPWRAVGIAVGAGTEKNDQSKDLEAEASLRVTTALREGLDLANDRDNDEIRRRIVETLQPA